MYAMVICRNECHSTKVHKQNEIIYSSLSRKNENILNLILECTILLG